MTALETAAELGQSEVVAVLVDKADAGGKTPADWARRSNDENALYVLREAKPETAYGRNIFQAKPEKPEP